MSARACLVLGCPSRTYHRSGLCSDCRAGRPLLTREFDQGPCACPAGPMCTAPPCPWFNAAGSLAAACTCHRCEAVPELLEVASETIRRVSR